MLVAARKEVNRILNSLSKASRRISAVTSDFETPSSQDSSGRSWSTEAKDKLIWIGCAVALLVVVAIYSRLSQYDTMILNAKDYFLPDLTNVSTTADSALYLNQARSLITASQTQNEEWELLPGGLLPHLLAGIATLKATTPEVAGRYLVYASAALTSVAAFLYLMLQGQKRLGLLVGCSLSFFWPVYSRTSIGMIDTDLLNLFFVLAILAIFAAASKLENIQALICASALAGLLNFTFYLWYGRPGFLVVFCLTLVMTLLSYGRRLLDVIMALSFFTLFSGIEQTIKAFDSLQNFYNRYVYPTFQNGSGDSVSIDPTSLIFVTISEISRLDEKLILSDFGSKTAFIAALFGLFVWLASDWRRIPLAFPLLCFLGLYMLSGHRFGFYASPLLVAGLFMIFPVVIKQLSPLYRIAATKIFDGFFIEAPIWKSFKKRRSHAKALAAILLFLMCWPLNILPSPGTLPPPLITAAEASYLRRLGSELGKEGSVMATWWDYGHEVRYQSGHEVLVDGGNPADIRNIYIARALVSPNVNYSATQLRVAAYFKSSQLSLEYPNIPPESQALGTDRDIYLVLPRDLQFKMLAIFNIASATLNRDVLRNYDSHQSTFFVLFHKSPQRHGPFELVLAQEDGLKVYRLRSPTQ